MSVGRRPQEAGVDDLAEGAPLGQDEAVVLGLHEVLATGRVLSQP